MHVHELHVSNTTTTLPHCQESVTHAHNFMSVTHTPPPSPSYSIGGKQLACTPRPCDFSFQETNKNLNIVANDQNTERVQIKQKYRTTQIIMHILGMVMSMMQKCACSFYTVLIKKIYKKFWCPDYFLKNAYRATMFKKQ